SSLSIEQLLFSLQNENCCIDPQIIDQPRETNISAILVKKAGDMPEFWHRDTSFIATIEELYQRVKTKNRDLF
ncbi:hypothetical protein I4641_17035, partial [Waterburya agarophytonicola K14]|nr:hypothetical protein [Waterburya agarophytonicola KI4]